MLGPSSSDVPWRFWLELEQRQMMMDERSLLTSMLMRASLPRDPDRVAGDPSELPVRRAKPATVGRTVAGSYSGSSAPRPGRIA